MAEEKINFLTDSAVQEVFDTVRTVKQMGPAFQRPRGVPAGQLVGYWVEVLSEEPDDLNLWEVLVLGCRYISDVGDEEYVLFDRDENVRMKMTDPNLLRREDE